MDLASYVPPKAQKTTQILNRKSHVAMLIPGTFNFRHSKIWPNKRQSQSFSAQPFPLVVCLLKQLCYCNIYDLLE